MAARQSLVEGILEGGPEGTVGGDGNARSEAPSELARILRVESDAPYVTVESAECKIAPVHAPSLQARREDMPRLIGFSGTMPGKVRILSDTGEMWIPRYIGISTLFLLVIRLTLSRGTGDTFRRARDGSDAVRYSAGRCAIHDYQHCIQ